MYSVYFDWWPQGDRRLWHPVGLPALTEDEAEAVAKALAKVLPDHAWAWGPTNHPGVQELPVMRTLMFDTREEMMDSLLAWMHGTLAPSEAEIPSEATLMSALRLSDWSVSLHAEVVSVYTMTSAAVDKCTTVTEAALVAMTKSSRG